MIDFNKALPAPSHRVELAALAAALLIAAEACAHSESTAPGRSNATTLSIGFGENPEVGIQQSVRNLALEGLVRIERDGRPSPWLAEHWSASADGLTWRLRLRSGATFHDGEPVTAQVVRDIVARRLPEYGGPSFDDVQQVRASESHELEFTLKRKSTFLLDGLDLLIERRDDSPIGTGPFYLANRLPGNIEMRANPDYYGGKPAIDQILFKSYDSVRSAWADMLRGRVDMLYEVGTDALDSLSASTQTKVFTFQRPYAFLVFLNVWSPKLRDKSLRRALNAAIDRAALVAEALNGHGTPADGPVWPYHWTYSQDLPRFRFQPHRVSNGSDAVRFKCLILTDQSHERLGLAIQRQLRAAGVELAFEQVSPDQFVARFQAGDFEAGLVDARMGPSMLQQYLLWYSKAPNNWGHFSSPEVDAAFDRIRSASTDSAYEAAIAAFQSAIIEDPPAIFLAWGERLRAVSTRFEVYSEPGRDILTAPMLRLWRPAADHRSMTIRN